jgi:hypothetical protein
VKPLDDMPPVTESRDIVAAHADGRTWTVAGSEARYFDRSAAERVARAVIAADHANDPAYCLGEMECWGEPEGDAA